MKQVLADDETRPWWSQRARTQIEEVRRAFPWLTPEASAVVLDPKDGLRWWTFAGSNANASLAPALANLVQTQTTSDSLMIEFEHAVPLEAIQRAIDELRRRDSATLLPNVDPEALDGLKFSECLPPVVAVRVLGMRARDPQGMQQVLQAPVRLASG